MIVSSFGRANADTFSLHGLIIYDTKLIMYFKSVLVVLLGWSLFMTIGNDWHLIMDLWEVPLTMVFGSFISGFTAEGGGAIAFPVFTKVLNIVPADAKQFSLLIQSAGMVFASIFIRSQKIPIYSFVILPAVIGGALGQLISLLMGWVLVSSDLKWMFTIVIAALGCALILQQVSGIQRSDNINNTLGKRLLFLTGFIGGFLTINCGSGADMVAFVILTLVLNSTEKKATPTTVVIMAINSLVGVVLISIFGDWSQWAIDAWKTSIPVVIFGAPLGALFASKVNNSTILKALLFFITIEVVSTIFLVPIQSWVIPTFLIILAVMFLLVWRKKNTIVGV